MAFNVEKNSSGANKQAKAEIKKISHVPHRRNIYKTENSRMFRTMRNIKSKYRISVYGLILVPMYTLLYIYHNPNHPRPPTRLTVRFSFELFRSSVKQPEEGVACLH